MDSMQKQMTLNENALLLSNLYYIVYDLILKSVIFADFLLGSSAMLIVKLQTLSSKTVL